MTLKTKVVPIVQDGRDKGKTFFLTEMPAYQAQKWAMRVMQAGIRGGLDIPPEVMMQGQSAMGMYAVAAFLQMSWTDAEPLLDEMLECVRIIRDRNHPEMTFPLLPDDIEEVVTYFYLRAEVMQLHTNFSLPESPSTSTTASPAPSPSKENSPSTSTSPRQSVRQSPRKARAL